MIIENLKKRIYTSFALLFITFLIFIYEEIFLFFLLIVSNLVLIEFFFITNKIFKTKFYKLIFNIIFVIYLFLFCIIFFGLYSFFNSKVIIFSLLLCCIASDIGGYVFGNLFKGPKLTRISPKKTISGSIGSIFLSIFILQAIFFIFSSQLSLKMFFISVIVSIGCQTGDIFFSFLKRKAKLKDTGNYLPGHGGFLDRIDGILLGIPFGLISLKFLF